ncbi:MAG: hypothetical protein KatS3mg064_0615 [Tepidiforma sp.]|nr:hypothetical protein [Tepidiforma sp.]GIW17458.1 MAG: hypothetical protein KatS3mg064_0615 [Tepidiforma sp.]
MDPDATVDWDVCLDQWADLYGSADELVDELVAYLADLWVAPELGAGWTRPFDAGWWRQLLSPVFQQLDPWDVAVARAGLELVPSPRAWFEAETDEEQRAIYRAHLRGEQV